MAKVRHNVCFPSLLFRSFFFVQLQCTFQDEENGSLQGTSTFLHQKKNCKKMFLFLQRFNKRFKTNPHWYKITNIHSSKMKELVGLTKMVQMLQSGHFELRKITKFPILYTYPSTLLHYIAMADFLLFFTIC